MSDSETTSEDEASAIRRARKWLVQMGLVSIPCLLLLTMASDERWSWPWWVLLILLAALYLLNFVAAIAAARLVARGSPLLRYLVAVTSVAWLCGGLIAVALALWQGKVLGALAAAGGVVTVTLKYRKGTQNALAFAASQRGSFRR